MCWTVWEPSASYQQTLEVRNSNVKLNNLILACREKVKSVQNSLQISHSLLQSRRDELKKLWMENLEQKKICEILQQM
jgi:hypothetical protein